MTEQITGMVRKGLSKSKVELKSRLLDIETLVTKFLRRTGEMPEASLLASVLANLLDEKTRDMFINDNIMHDYKVMKTRILQIATDLTLPQGIWTLGRSVWSEQRMCTTSPLLITKHQDLGCLLHRVQSQKKQVKLFTQQNRARAIGMPTSDASHAMDWDTEQLIVQ